MQDKYSVEKFYGNILHQYLKFILITYEETLHEIFGRNIWDKYSLEKFHGNILHK